MAQFRNIKCKTWSDNWFTELSSEQKLLWLFLLTNQYVHNSGIYEIPRTWLATMSGVAQADEILEQFIQEGKVEYKEGWLFIRNFLLYQNLNSLRPDKDGVVKEIVNFLRDNPKVIALFGLQEHEIYSNLLVSLRDPQGGEGGTPPGGGGDPSGTRRSSSSTNAIASTSPTRARAFNNSDPVDQVIQVFKAELNPTLDFDDSTERRAATDMINEFNLKDVIAAAKKAIEVQDDEYAPRIVKPSDLKAKFANLKVHLRQKNRKK